MTAADWIPAAVVVICAWVGGTMPDEPELSASYELAVPPGGGYTLSDPAE